MKKYAIGELISNFNENYIAYAVNGENEGSIIFVDPANKRLTTIFPDGEACDCMFIKIADISEEEGKQWVFFHEIEDLELTKKANKQLTQSLIESLKNGYEYYTESEDKD